MKLKVTCRHCGSTDELSVTEEGYQRWHEGELIQRALPELTPDERELLISDTCGACFDKLFSES